MVEINEIFGLAAELVNNTTQSLFLTGKAGTGKTTFLKYIVQNSSKNTIVAAPTGVAAVNAGGTTVHSLFQLPLEPFLPENRSSAEHLFQNHIHKNKIEMLQKLELLIIDEVSMLRADVLDAIDLSLRRHRRIPLPFGGVQMLYIGDLFQLPPVVQDHEWEILKQSYSTPFFFHAKAIEKSPPLYVELKKIYRQNEQTFINLLNKIRHDTASDGDLALLNSRYNPEFVVPENSNYIILSTHNYKVDRINNSELGKLPGKEFVYTGAVKGTFSESSYPTDLELRLKIGAQVMFLKNDTAYPRRYYNGKLGVVKRLDDDRINVKLEGSDTLIDLIPETWKNVRYTLDHETKAIKEEETGSFTQLPIRLAWAITIHKSQGLTFEHAVIDAAASFSAGQVYVALSRCTTLEGIVLHSKINADSIKTAPEVVEFAKKERQVAELSSILAVERPKYLRRRLFDVFEWKDAIVLANELFDLALSKADHDHNDALSFSSHIRETVYNQNSIVDKFRKQLDLLLTAVEQTGDVVTLKDRVAKAAKYFSDDFQTNIFNQFDKHIEKTSSAKKVKQYLSAVSKIYDGLVKFADRFKHITYGSHTLVEAETPVKQETAVPEPEKPKKVKAPKAPKGSTFYESLALFRQGSSIDEIAAKRGLARSTIEGHLAMFVRTGEVDISELVPDEKYNRILPFVEGLDAQSALHDVKQQLGDDYSYGEIRATLYHLLSEV